MGVFDLFKKKKTSKDVTENRTDSGSMSKEEIFRMILEMQGQRSPSDQFVSGVVFDISKLRRELFLDALHSNNAAALRELFIQSYLLLLENPEAVGIAPQMINRNNNDTNPTEWNADIIRMSDGAYAALLFMPIQNKDISARIVGIIFGDEVDGYYYCMLNSNENTTSVVHRNKAMQGIHDIGEVKGLGFELMNSFVNCIQNDYYSI